MRIVIQLECHIKKRNFLTINDKTNKPIQCLFHKQFVGEFFKAGTSSRIEVTETIFSDIPPIQISPHGSFGGIIAFPYLKDKFPLPKDDTINQSNYWSIKIGSITFSM